MQTEFVRSTWWDLCVGKMNCAHYVITHRLFLFSAKSPFDGNTCRGFMHIFEYSHENCNKLDENVASGTETSVCSTYKRDIVRVDCVSMSLVTSAVQQQCSAAAMFSL